MLLSTDIPSSTPGLIVTPESEEAEEEDKIIVTPEPGPQTTPEALADDSTGESELNTTTVESLLSMATKEPAETTTQIAMKEADISPMITSTALPINETVEESTKQPSLTVGVEEVSTPSTVLQTEEPTSEPPVSVSLADVTSATVEFDNETSSLYPVTVSSTVTPSPAPWPYPTSSTTTPPGMSTGACLFDSRVYMSAQQILRDDPCDFCFCFRGDIICLQQSCPPPIPGCYEEPIPGFCCPRYECPVGNSTSSTHALFPSSYYHNQVLNNLQPSSVPPLMTGTGPGCEVQGEYYEPGQKIRSASGPCLECRLVANNKCTIK